MQNKADQWGIPKSAVIGALFGAAAFATRYFGGEVSSDPIAAAAQLFGSLVGGAFLFALGAVVRNALVRVIWK